MSISQRYLYQTIYFVYPPPSVTFIILQNEKVFLIHLSEHNMNPNRKKDKTFYK